VNKGWLIYDDDVYGELIEAYVFLDETEALEMYMSLCDEEMYMTFAWMTQDELADDTLEDMIFYTVTQHYISWCVKEIPVYGNTCC
jgi:hypothetical protein